MPYGTVNADKMTTSDGVSSSGLYGFKNRLINGACVIDQRNAGASVTQNTSAQYTLDRWFIYGDVTSKFTVQQNAGSVTPPAGFTNYLGVTSSSAYTVGASEIFVVQQRIEGYNIADLAWGTANAQTVTLSFWVRSSLTGTFGGSLKNSSGARSYPFTYSVPTANTWTQINITIAGDTSGTWLTTNGIGITMTFSMGCGSSTSSTAGSWSAGNYSSATGATSVVGTNGATFYITGVQLEKGSTATSFDYRPYGTELQLCQRYCTVFGTPSLNQYVHLGTGSMYTGTAVNISVALPVSMRTTPTISKTVNGSSVWLQVYIGSTGYQTNSTPEVGEYLSVGSNAMRIYCPSSYTSGTAGYGAWCQVINGAQFVFSSEL